MIYEDEDILTILARYNCITSTFKLADLNFLTIMFDHIRKFYTSLPDNLRQKIKDITPPYYFDM